MGRKALLRPPQKVIAQYKVSDMYKSARKGLPLDMVEDSDERPAAVAEIEQTLSQVYIPPEFRKYFEDELKAATFPRQKTVFKPKPRAAEKLAEDQTENESTLEDTLQEVEPQTPAKDAESEAIEMDYKDPFTVGKFRDDDRRRERLPGHMGESIHRLLNYLLTPAATKRAFASAIHPLLQSSNLAIESVKVSAGVRKATVTYSVYDDKKREVTHLIWIVAHKCIDSCV